MGHHHHHHHHHHDFSAGTADPATLKRIRLAFALNLGFSLLQFVGGILTGSLAIIADAVHDLGDSFSLGLALVLEKRAAGEANDDWTYGYRRLSVLSALICGLVLISGSSIVLYEGLPRIWALFQDSTGVAIPHSVGMMGLAAVGIAVNGWAALGLSRGGSQNERVLTLHMIEDLLGWIAVLAGAVVIHFTNWSFVDPLLAVGIAIFIFISVIKSLRSTLEIFLQRTPAGFDPSQIKEKIQAIEGVVSLVDHHAWSLDGEQHVFTCHLKINDSAAETQVKEAVRELLRKHHFSHITIEIVHPGEEVLCHT